LRAEADCKTHWEDAAVQRFASAANGSVPQSTAAAPLSNPAPALELDCAHVAQSTFAALSDEEKRSIPAKGQLPPGIDGRLLSTGRAVAKRSLADAEKRQLRAVLRQLAQTPAPG
jgi:hypothetical protein